MRSTSNPRCSRNPARRRSRSGSSSRRRSSSRRKRSAFQSAMSMLTFYINRAGRSLPEPRKRTLEIRKGRAAAIIRSIAVAAGSRGVSGSTNPAHGRAGGTKRRPRHCFPENAEPPCPIRSLTRRRALGQVRRRPPTPGPEVIRPPAPTETPPSPASPEIPTPGPDVIIPPQPQSPPGSPADSPIVSFDESAGLTR